ncbi:hypothetical protein KEM56_001776 [Ascosphaera pollenicola]|nr:hypothetical protein KEM56_001776 [Ascosphaera pollenicola]
MEWSAPDCSSATGRTPRDEVIEVMPQEHNEIHFPQSGQNPTHSVSMKKSRLRRVCLLTALIVICLTAVFASALYIAYTSIVHPASISSTSSKTPTADQSDWDNHQSFGFVVQHPIAIPDYPDSPEMPNFKNAFKKTFGLDHNRPDESQQQGPLQTQLDPAPKPKLPFNNKKLPGTPEIISDPIVLTDNERTDGTYPRLCRLSDGTILASFTRIDGDVHILVVSFSTDNGRTFQEIGEIARAAGDVDNAHLVEVSSAPQTVIAAFRNHDLDSQGRPTHYRITVCGSPDGGKSWTFFSHAAETSPPNGVWEPFVRIGVRGEVHLAYSQEFAPDDQRTLLVTSQNRGLTWSKPIDLDERTLRLRDGMCGITQTRDTANGKDVLVMVVETTRFPGKFDVEGLLSYDDGMTYEGRHIVYNPSPTNVLHNQANPDVQSANIPDIYNAGAPQIASFKADGSLICVFMTDEDAPPDSVSWTRHAAIKAVYAPPPRNGTIEWGPPILIANAESYWPGVLAIDDRTVMVTYDNGGPKGTLIRWK